MRNETLAWLHSTDSRLRACTWNVESGYWNIGRIMGKRGKFPFPGGNSFISGKPVQANEPVKEGSAQPAGSSYSFPLSSQPPAQGKKLTLKERMALRGIAGKKTKEDD